MTAAEFLIDIRDQNTDVIPDDFLNLYRFSPVQLDNGQIVDANFTSRTAIAKELLNDFSLRDIHLIRSLLHEEMVCERELLRNDNLYQLCYYLYELAQLEDVFVLYDATYNNPNMEDVGTMLDRSMLALKHNIDEVIIYVADRFVKEPSLKEKYPKLMMALEGFKVDPDFEDINDYTEYIRDKMKSNRGSTD